MQHWPAKAWILVLMHASSTPHRDDLLTCLTRGTEGARNTATCPAARREGSAAAISSAAMRVLPVPGDEGGRVERLGHLGHRTFLPCYFKRQLSRLYLFACSCVPVGAGRPL